MSTAKEKVLAYLRDRAGKQDEDQMNGCRIEHFHSGLKVVVDRWWIKLMGKPVFSVGTKSPRETFETAARILKLDKPKAAEIVWRDWKNVLGGATRISTCGNYTLERQMVGGTSVYFTGCDRRDLVAESSSGMAEAALYPACQDHKQNRLEELL